MLATGQSANPRSGSRPVLQEKHVPDNNPIHRLLSRPSPASRVRFAHVSRSTDSRIHPWLYAVTIPSRFDGIPFQV